MRINLRTLRFLLFSLLCIPTLPAMAGEEVGAGELNFGRPGSMQAPALHLGSSVHIEISGMLAQVVLRQSFRNDSGQWQEGRYVFPLPEQAAVNRLRMVVGEREILGEIRERAKAREEYRKARASGRKASLVEQHRPNLFSNNIANIAPGETVQVELTYTQVIEFDAGLFSLRFPTTLTPRYFPGRALESSADQLLADASTGWAQNTDQVPDAREISPRALPPTIGEQSSPINPIAISAELDMGLPLALIESPWHEISLSEEGERYHVALARGEESMDRDFELRWRPVTGREPQAALFRELTGDQEYALLMLVPPAPDAREPMAALPRELIFVIDTSGSMGGSPIRQARASLGYALGLLQADDRFNVIEFNNTARSLFPTAVAANNVNLSRAREFVNQLEAGGGTEMQSALQLALRTDGGESHLRQVVFITDGAVGNELELFKQIQARLGASRLFTVGIGSAPNSWFMRKAAEFGRGRFTYVGDQAQVQHQMQQLFARLSRPLVSGLRVDWGGPAEVWPRRIPELYSGEPMLVVARFSDPDPDREISVTGASGEGRWQRLVSGAAEASHPGVAATWARRKIEDLLDGRVLGRAEKEVREEVLPLALEHQLLSPYTSFIAVENIVSRPRREQLKKSGIPNASPAGQAAQAYAWPKTGAGLGSKLLLGCLLLLAWMFTVALNSPLTTEQSTH